MKIVSCQYNEVTVSAESTVSVLLRKAHKNDRSLINGSTHCVQQWSGYTA